MKAKGLGKARGRENQKDERHRHARQKGLLRSLLPVEEKAVLESKDTHNKEMRPTRYAAVEYGLANKPRAPTGTGWPGGCRDCESFSS